MCHTAERFFAVQKCLVTLVESLQQAPSVRLLKHIIRCFLRLTDNARAREALRTHTPMLLLDPDFTACLKDDGQTRQCAPLPLSSLSRRMWVLSMLIYSNMGRQNVCVLTHRVGRDQCKLSM